MPAYSNVLPLLVADRLFQDLRTALSSLAPGAIPADPIVYGPGGSVRIRGFDGGVTLESMDFVAEFPNSYAEGTDIHPHVHWVATTNNAGNVKWNLDYYWQNIGDTIPVLTTISVVQAASGTAWLVQDAGFTNIVGTGKGLGHCWYAGSSGTLGMCRIRTPMTQGFCRWTSTIWWTAPGLGHMSPSEVRR